jgi:hypothetical protein
VLDTADEGLFSTSEHKGSVVGHLVLRDYTVTITLVQGGRRYTVASHDGRVLATDVDGQHLAAHFPAVHELYEGSVAGGTGLWAGL